MAARNRNVVYTWCMAVQITDKRKWREGNYCYLSVRLNGEEHGQRAKLGKGLTEDYAYTIMEKLAKQCAKAVKYAGHVPQTSEQYRKLKENTGFLGGSIQEWDMVPFAHDQEEN